MLFYGSVFVADYCNYCIQKFTAVGEFITARGIKGEGKGEFLYSFGVVLNSLGNVYVSEYGSHCI